MIQGIVGKIRRAIHKPPQVILTRLAAELRAEGDRFLSPVVARRLTLPRLLHELGSPDLPSLWSSLAQRPYLSIPESVGPEEYDALCPGSRERIVRAAGDALAHRVNLLGSGPVNLGDKIDWHTDFKAGYRWTPAYIRSIHYGDPKLSSDVKVPWELSRMQWLIPAAQAYLLTRKEEYALCVRDVLSQWIEANPYAHSVNWTCTMDVALRILSWTWLFHVLHRSAAWSDEDFRYRFLQALFLHGIFTARHLEQSDVNGNHYTADAAGLAFAGLFFGSGPRAKTWADLGWKILTNELPRQVYSDGVDFEGSVPYHRLVLELFFLPAIYRERLGLPVPESYKQRIGAMAHFTAAYSRGSLSIPLWGDADDARALPFGGQSINDHRYLTDIVARQWGISDLAENAPESAEEIYWLLGKGFVPIRNQPGCRAPSSIAFKEGGFYVMRNERDHVFIDCGPIGLAGRGGHGHNDCLSFEAVLEGVHLISDCGAFVYTASYKERNNFRSTAYHNTPQVDDQEINRFVRWDNLWSLHYDAKPEVHQWLPGAEEDLFIGSHRGYERLDQPVTPTRTIRLIHAAHELIVEDRFEGKGDHRFRVPLHLAPGVVPELQERSQTVLLTCGERRFILSWEPADWDLHIESARISPSYGVSEQASRIVWSRSGPVEIPLRLSIVPRYDSA